MLDIKNMFDDNKLFSFMSNLQGWAQTELRRQGVQDLIAVMAATDCLVDYKMGSTIFTTQKSKLEGAKKAKFEAKTFTKSRWKKQKGKDVAFTKHPKKNSKVVQPPIRPSGCFIYNGPHRAHDCPKREKLIALVSREDKEDSNLNGHSRVSLLQLLNVIRSQLAASKSLMFVQALANRVRVKVMVDSGAIHNFVAMRESERLGLKLEEDTSRIKAMNNKAQKIHGMPS